MTKTKDNFLPKNYNIIFSIAKMTLIEDSQAQVKTGRTSAKWSIPYSF